MSYYDRYSGYKSSGITKEEAAKALAKYKKKNPDSLPVVIEGRKIASSWWGIAWCENLERYADFGNRIARGKQYVRKGAVLDLKITPGFVLAVVQGSRAKPYEIAIGIDILTEKEQAAISKRCGKTVKSLEALTNGEFPDELKDIFFDKDYGLFPSPDKISFSCSCPDWASMCKHVAAVLYGIGSRFDDDPLMFFHLRGVDTALLLRDTIDKRVDDLLKNFNVNSERIIPENDIHELFGI